MPRYVLRLSCPDRKGIVHAVAGALLEVDANICENAQFGDELAGRFCMRTLFETASDAAAVTKALGPVMTDIEAEYTIRADTDRPKVLIMVSRFDHCLLDLLYRWASGELAIDIVCIVSNHGALAHVADSNGIRFEYLPITPDNKAEQEDALRQSDQHPPFVPSRLQGCSALPSGLRPRREADRRHRAFRDTGP